MLRVRPLLILWGQNLRIHEIIRLFGIWPRELRISKIAIYRIAILGTLLGTILVQGSLHCPHAKVRKSYVMLINLQRNNGTYIRGNEWILRVAYNCYIVQIARMRISHVLLRTLHYACKAAATYKPPSVLPILSFGNVAF